MNIEQLDEIRERYQEIQEIFPDLHVGVSYPTAASMPVVFSVYVEDADKLPKGTIDRLRAMVAPYEFKVQEVISLPYLDKNALGQMIRHIELLEEIAGINYDVTESSHAHETQIKIWSEYKAFLTMLKALQSRGLDHIYRMATDMIDSARAELDYQMKEHPDNKGYEKYLARLEKLAKKIELYKPEDLLSQ